MAIEIKGVSKRFGTTQALDSMSFALPEQQITGLLGNNGAGKSTLLSIITDRLRADSGTVEVDGESVVNNDSALGKIFLMSEQNMFPDDMRVRGALDTAAMFYNGFDMSFAQQLCSKFGLDTRKKIKALSTGYTSIFRLILGLSVNTPYVMYDEPVLGLDAQHRDMFYRTLIEHFAEHPATVLISTHLISEVANIIGNTVIVRSGRILKNAPTDELLCGAYTITGSANAVDDYVSGKSVISINRLGGISSACLNGSPENIPDGLEVGRMGLQDYFINLMNEEDAK